MFHVKKCGSSDLFCLFFQIRMLFVVLDFTFWFFLFVCFVFCFVFILILRRKRNTHLK